MAKYIKIFLIMLVVIYLPWQILSSPGYWFPGQDNSNEMIVESYRENFFHRAFQSLPSPIPGVLIIYGLITGCILFIPLLGIKILFELNLEDPFLSVVGLIFTAAFWTLMVYFVELDLKRSEKKKKERK